MKYDVKHYPTILNLMSLIALVVPTANTQKKNKTG